MDADTLSSLASRYANGMTSIRGRRVQRLLRREFAGAEFVLSVQAGAGPAVLGLSASGAAFCATDGRGPRALVVKWLHGSAEALEAAFDLHKDSLPLLDTKRVPLVGPPRDALLGVAPSSLPRAARDLLATAVQALPAPADVA
jgi:hypothetical protein